jgi:hypothetical protein
MGTRVEVLAADQVGTTELTTYRLWHNLTTSLMEFVFLPGTGEYQIELYEK